MLNIEVCYVKIADYSVLAQERNQTQTENLAFSEGLYPFGSFFGVVIKIRFAFNDNGICVFKEFLPACDCRKRNMGEDLFYVYFINGVSSSI